MFFIFYILSMIFLIKQNIPNSITYSIQISKNLTNYLVRLSTLPGWLVFEYEAKTEKNYTGRKTITTKKELFDTISPYYKGTDEINAYKFNLYD